MIVSASRRTDIPCLYSAWMMQRIRAGEVLVRNPLNPHRVSRVILSPDTVDCIVFWTKDPAPMLAHLDELDARGYRYYFQFTLTPYGADIEPHLRPKDALVHTFRALAQRIGPQRVVWRYDPILLTPAYTPARHEELFARMSDALAGCTDQVTISFVDLCRSARAAGFSAADRDTATALAEKMARRAREAGMRTAACCEWPELARVGVEPAACIDKARIERLCGAPLCTAPDKNQRPGCGCCASVDIGAYGTCTNGCAYCYADRARPPQPHDDASPLLAGAPGPGDVLSDRRAASDIITEQLTLF